MGCPFCSHNSSLKKTESFPFDGHVWYYHRRIFRVCFWDELGCGQRFGRWLLGSKVRGSGGVEPRWGQLLLVVCGRVFWSSVEVPAGGAVTVPEGLIQGSERRDAPVVVVAVMVTWIIWSRWMSRIRAFSLSREAWVSFCWLRRPLFMSMHFWTRPESHWLLPWAKQNSQISNWIV